MPLLRLPRPRLFRRLVFAIVLFICLTLVWASFRSKPSRTAADIQDGFHRIGSSRQDNVKDKAKKSKSSVIDKPSDFDSGDLSECQRIVPFGRHYHANISTYDLPAKTDYTLDAHGRYKIPVKSPEDFRGKTLEPVQVFVVPFSHADPGYGMTMEEYYRSKVIRTLNSMMHKLSENRNLTFQWAETVFLNRWWDNISEQQKQTVRLLIERGQLEIVLGGWVMPDEASTYYPAVVDQLIEGHQWLVEHLGVYVKNAWVNDPFGYSGTMPYLWKSAGIENMVFLRIHQAIKSTLMKMKSLEFNWRPYWKKDTDSDFLCTLMSYEGYWVDNVCGPNSTICDQFAFMHDRAARITDQNVERKATVLYEQYRLTSDLYRYNTLYIGIGEDFSFTERSHWDSIYQNFDKLMQYINSRKEWNMKVKFGTLADYFQHVRNVEKQKAKVNSDLSFPSLSGDFFPYSDKEDAYWTGYFTTRPLNKRIAREIEPLLRLAEKYNVIAYAYHKQRKMPFDAYKEVASHLRVARREIGMFLHHDGITGTSLPHVVMDFETRLFTAEKSANSAMKILLMTLLTDGAHPDVDLLKEEMSRPRTRQISDHMSIDCRTREVPLLLVNPLAKRREEYVNVFVQSKSIEIVSADGDKLPVQVTEVTQGRYIASFHLPLPPLATEIVSLKTVPLAKFSGHFATQETQFPHDTTEPIVLSNAHMRLEFDGTTGMLRRVTDRNGRITEVVTEFLAYKSLKSGAYLFGPNGPAEPFPLWNPVITVTKGLHVSRVTVQSAGIYHRVIIYNSSGTQGRGIYIRNEIDIASRGDHNTEIVLRFRTDLRNGNNFFTDQNGFQYLGRKTVPENLIQSNFYPLSTMAFLEDASRRLTLHAGQPHGVAALQQGWLEVMLDRTMLRDDGRGLGQGVMDTVPTDSEFILQIEHSVTPHASREPRYSAPTIAASMMNEYLQNPVQKFIAKYNTFKLAKKLRPMPVPFPCDVHIVGFRNLVRDDYSYNGTSLVLHRKPNVCDYESTELECDMSSDAVTLSSLFPNRSLNITETSLSHLYTKQRLSLSDDLRPSLNELRAFKVEL